MNKTALLLSGITILSLYAMDLATKESDQITTSDKKKKSEEKPFGQKDPTLQQAFCLLTYKSRAKVKAIEWGLDPKYYNSLG